MRTSAHFFTFFAFDPGGHGLIKDTQDRTTRRLIPLSPTFDDFGLSHFLGETLAYFVKFLNKESSEEEIRKIFDW
jgi:hypothetical protein